MSLKIFWSVLFSAAVVSFPGINSPLRAQTKEAKKQPSGIEEGKTKFKQLCVSCHGASGKGDGVAAAAFPTRPKDLTQTKLTTAELKKVIQKGGAAAGLSPLMPPWEASLSEEELSNVIAYIHSLGKK